MANKDVADLVDSSSYNWNHELVRKLYHYPLSEDILQIPLAKTDGGQDRIIWKHSNSGDFQVKKAYDLLHKDYRDSNPTQFRSTDLPKETWPLVWKVKLPVKISTFIWKLLHDCLPVKLNLTNRGIPTNNNCPMCKEEIKSSSHLFLARVVWFVPP